jgi:hypothetical protein
MERNDWTNDWEAELNAVERQLAFEACECQIMGPFTEEALEWERRLAKKRTQIFLGGVDYSGITGTQLTNALIGEPGELPT